MLTSYRTDGTDADLADLSTNVKVAKFDYAVRADGKRTGSVETHYTSAGAVQFTDTYTWTYDRLGRLVDETLDSTHAGTPQLRDYKTTYSFDLAGNRLGKNTDTDNNASIDEFFSYAYDANDRLTTETNDIAGGTTLDRFTEYEYGSGNAGTQQTKKTVKQGLTTAGTTLEERAFAYDLQGRMEVVTVTTRNGSGVATRIEKTTYDYDAAGFRISALAQTDTDANGTWDTTTRTTFLADSKTPTGYTQVLRESTFNGSGVLTTTVDYSFGHDELTQVTRQYAANGTVTSETTLVFSHDGHGSVRVVTDMLAALQQLFVYDAYGQLLAIVNSAGAVTTGGGGTSGLANAALALTSSLYNGETFDVRIALQYLRARWYDAANGRFPTKDEFFGNQSDPQSFHKYTFTHGDPTNFNDPTGMYGEGLIGTIATAGLRAGLMSMIISAPFRVYTAVTDLSGEASLRDVAIGFVQGMATDFAIGAVLGGAGSGLTRLFASNTFKIRFLGQSIVNFAAARVPWSAWRLAPLARGLVIEKAILGRAAGFLGRQIPRFEVIDDFIIRAGRGIATSIKSLDLTANTYQRTSALLSRLNQYASELNAFAGARLNGFVVGPGGHTITDRVLVVALEEGAATAAQAQALAQFVREAATKFPGIKVVLQFVP